MIMIFTPLYACLQTSTYSFMSLDYERLIATCLLARKFYHTIRIADLHFLYPELQCRAFVACLSARLETNYNKARSHTCVPQAQTTANVV